MNWRVTTAVMAVLVMFCAAQDGRGQTVFTDSFSSISGTFSNTQTFTSSTTYTVTSTTSTAAGTGTATLNSAVLQLNTGGGTAITGATASTSAYSGGYNSILSSNAGQLINWSFNLRQTRTDPSGFDTGNYGTTVVIGANGTDLRTAGGYAVVLGQSGSTDPIRLVSFTNGLDLNSNLTNIVSTGDFGANFLSIQVQYSADTSAFTLSVRDDSGAFADPATGSGFTTTASVANSAFTSTPLTTFGFVFNHSTGVSELAQFDNYTVALAPVPEPATVFGLAAAGLGVFAGVRRRFRKGEPATAA